MASKKHLKRGNSGSDWGYPMSLKLIEEPIPDMPRWRKKKKVNPMRRQKHKHQYKHHMIVRSFYRELISTCTICGKKQWKLLSIEKQHLDF